MRDYKVYLPHHRDDQVDQLDRKYSLIISLVVLVFLIGLVCFSCVDAVVKTAEIQERFYSMPVAVTYDRPAAYRLATPTADQMDQMEALAVIQPLVRR